MGAVMRQPVMVVGLLLMCFPLKGIVCMIIAAAIAAVVGAAVLVCRIISKRSSDGSCPCKRLVSRFFPKPDPDAADFAD